jgi:hypothetical protein
MLTRVLITVYSQTMNEAIQREHVVLVLGRRFRTRAATGLESGGRCPPVRHYEPAATRLYSSEVQQPTLTSTSESDQSHTGPAEATSKHPAFR